MLKPLLTLLLLLPCLALARPAGDRTLSVTTHDSNGLHVVMLLDTADYARSAVRHWPQRGDADVEVADYSRPQFEALWQRAQALGLADHPVLADPVRANPSTHYVITVGSANAGGGLDRINYLVRKCDVAPAVAAFVADLTAGLLPAASPEVPAACVEPAEDGATP